MEPTTETPIEAPARKKPGRKPGRRAKVRTEPAKPVPAEFAGMTAQACCDACNPKDGCCITRNGGSGTCAHPLKGGLQAADMMRPAVLACFQRAKKAMRHVQIDMRTDQ